MQIEKWTTSKDYVFFRLLSLHAFYRFLLALFLLCTVVLVCHGAFTSPTRFSAVILISSQTRNKDSTMQCQSRSWLFFIFMSSNRFTAASLFGNVEMQTKWWNMNRYTQNESLSSEAATGRRPVFIISHTTSPWVWNRRLNMANHRVPSTQGIQFSWS